MNIKISDKTKNMIFIQKHKYQKCEIVNSTFIIKGYFLFACFWGCGEEDSGLGSNDAHQATLGER